MKAITNGSNNASITGTWKRVTKMKRTRPRKSRDRRLLESLASHLQVNLAGELYGYFNKLKGSQVAQLIAIKAKMKGGGK